MIYLFQYDVSGNGIDFVLNEEIAADMYPDSGELEVKLSLGLGQYIDDEVKKLLFENGKLTSTLLAEVMNRRTLESRAHRK